MSAHRLLEQQYIVPTLSLDLHSWRLVIATRGVQDERKVEQWYLGIEMVRCGSSMAVLGASIYKPLRIDHANGRNTSRSVLWTVDLVHVRPYMRDTHDLYPSCGPVKSLLSF